MKELTIDSISIGAIAKFVGVWYAIFGFVVGLLSGISGAVSVVSNNPDYSVIADIFIVVGIVLGGVIVFPLVMFVFGWLHGAILGIIFDVVNKNSGGLKIKVSEKTLK